MSISAAAEPDKMVNFGGVVFGFSLHHLFMHMNLFWPPFGLARFAVLRVLIFGLQ